MEAEAPPEVRQEVEEASVIEEEGVLGEQEEEEASVGEVVEEIIPILRGLALVGEDHSLFGLALRQKAFCVWENTQRKSVRFNNFN